MLTICFEGIDGCGKSTQAKMLEKALQEMGYYPCLLNHPGQTKFGQEIKNLILNGTQPKADIAHRLLF
jgi:dTMP kinase